jgi:hypothetical protein
VGPVIDWRIANIWRYTYDTQTSRSFPAAEMSATSVGMTPGVGFDLIEIRFKSIYRLFGIMSPWWQSG